MFFFGVIKQKPTPQLNVLSISLSDIFFVFNHLKILPTLMRERSMLTDSSLGTDLGKFSIKPPPVI